jgi:ABC-2 type transport system ATP-binding protein
MIRARGLTKRFGARLAVEDLTLEVPGGILVLLGPNGAGKTTTVRLLLGLLRPTAGGAEVAGLPIDGEGPALRRACGLLPEAPGLYERLSALENLRFFGRLYGLSRAEADARSRPLLERFDLWARRDDPAGALSKGMRQKVALVRALFHDPRVLFLDEPTSGLDPESARGFRELILELRGGGRTVVVCTHNLDEAERLADWVAIVRTRLLHFQDGASLREGRGSRRLRVRVRGAGAAHEQALRPLAPGGALRRDGDWLSLDVADAAGVAPEAVRRLVAAGADVVEVLLERESLESLYLRTVSEVP